MGNTRKITVLGTSETKLLGELSKIRKTNICVPSYRIRILSYDRDMTGKMKKDCIFFRSEKRLTAFPL